MLVQSDSLDIFQIAWLFVGVPGVVFSELIKCFKALPRFAFSYAGQSSFFASLKTKTGGGAGSRTRVRDYYSENIYTHSYSFSLVQ